MTADVRVTLGCDCEGCDATFGLPDLTVGATRRAAFTVGWCHEYGGVDYCPAHNDEWAA